MKRRIIGPYSPKRVVNFKTKGPSLTHQSFKEECDINRIMKKWEKTGIIEHRNNFEGRYADFTVIPNDYHEAMNSVVEAQNMFMTLPASVRKRFANDPGEFLEFVTDPNNQDEVVKLGLASERVVEAATEAKPKNEGGEPKKGETPPKKAAPATDGSQKEGA